MSRFTACVARLAADPVLETKMATEILRDTDQLDQHDDDEHDQGGEQSDGTRAGAEPEEGEEQKKAKAITTQATRARTFIAVAFTPPRG